MISLSYIFLILFFLTFAAEVKYLNFSQEEIIIDADYKIEEISIDSNVPEKIKKSLTLIAVEYFSFDSLLHRGQILIQKDLANDLKEIFQIIN